MGPLAQVGLALATSIGAWINLGLVIWFAARAGHAGMDGRLRQSLIKFAIAGLVLAGVLWFCQAPVTDLFSQWHRLHNVATVASLALIGGACYVALLLALFGPRWFVAFRTHP
jgi:putative peptidoglycan lipid II flippase